MDAEASSLALDPRRVVDIVTQLAHEVSDPRQVVTLDSDLEVQVGLGSLERAELVTRLEQSFALTLPDRALTEARSARDLHALLCEAVRGGSGAAPTELGAPPRAESASEAHWAVPSPDDAPNLVELMRYRAERDGELGHLHLIGDEGDVDVISFGELWTRSLDAASGLSRAGLRPGDRVALLFPTCAEFFTAFLGTLAAGGVPVPIYPPLRLDQLPPYLARHGRILGSCSARWLLTCDALSLCGGLLRDQVDSLEASLTVAELGEAEAGFGPARIDADQLGLIQYTSGSTGDPKGVSLRHRNLLANMRAIGSALELGPRDVCVSWLPLYHDMGLIGAWLTSLLHRTPLYLMTPLQFLSRPERWLWAFHRFRGTISPAPNFAYELCVRKIPDHVIEGLDLSSWRVAMNGAEPIQPGTIRRFAERFAPHGLRAETMLPVYGLAETSVALTFPAIERAPRLDSIQREAFAATGRAEPSEDPADSLEFYSVGRPLAAHEVRLVPTDDPTGEPIEERQQGRILFRGPSSLRGYYARPEASAAIRHGDWLDTGDLGYLADGELFITGRVKDLVIKGGRNYHPQDIEAAAWDVEGVRKGCVVAFSAPESERGEVIVVVAETRQPKARHPELKSAIRAAVLAQIGCPADHVVLATPGTIPKTSSGKLRRRETRQLYIDGALNLRRRPWLSFVRIIGRSFLSRSLAAARIAARGTYGVYASLVCALFVMLIGTLVILFGRSERAAWRIIRRLARVMFWCMGTRVRRHGEPLPDGHFVIVSNHTSFIDPLVLIAALERPLVFTPKAASFDLPFVGSTMRRLGCIPIVRTTGATFLESYRHAAEALDGGRLVHIFPEGTFTGAAGLRTFRLGAFQLAAERGRPLVPIALRGVREFLHSDRTLFRFVRQIDVFVRPARSAPSEGGIRALAALREEVRAELGALAEEPLLDITTAGLPPTASP